MPRISLRDVCMILPRSCVRYRSVILWACISLFTCMGFIAMICHDTLSDDVINWTFRGKPLRDSPYGRQQHLINDNVQFNINDPGKMLGRKLTRNNAVAGGGVGNLTGGGVIVESLNIALKDISQLNSLLNTKLIPAPTDLDIVKDIPDVIAQPDLPPDFNPHLGCEEIATLQLTRRVGRGTTKDVYASKYRNLKVAVKMVSPKVADIKACLRRKLFRNREECYVYANYKIMKEIALYQQLTHPNIATLIGYCIQSEPLFSSIRDHGVISVVEFGAKASLHRITGMSWRNRLEATVSLADLLDYLEHSPLGSLAIWDYKHSQFILTADNKIKYSDLDDLSADELQCETNDDCVIPKSNRIRVQCTNSRCDGFNAKFNLLRTTKEFFKPLLKDAPEEYRTDLDDMFEKLNTLQISAKDVKMKLTKLGNRNASQEVL